VDGSQRIILFVLCRAKGEAIFIAGAFNHRSYIFLNSPELQTAKRLRVMGGVIKSEVEDELRDALAGLKPEEAAVLAMLRSRLAKEVAAKSGPIGETAHAA
jgi:hypothetical protein